MLVFCYGTLRGGYWGLDGGQFVADGVVRNHTLISLGGFPGMVESLGHHVVGEVWNIPADTLQRLDAFESEGRLYHRRKVAVEVDGYGTKACYAYILGRPMRDEEITFPDWLEYKYGQDTNYDRRPSA